MPEHATYTPRGRLSRLCGTVLIFAVLIIATMRRAAPAHVHAGPEPPSIPPHTPAVLPTRPESTELPTVTVSSPTPTALPVTTATPRSTAASTPERQSQPTPVVQTPTPTLSPAQVQEVDIDTPAIPDKFIALTFDCGYSAASLNRILATLDTRSAQATFFLEGKWIERSPQIVAPIAAAGHEIGSHSYSHPDFTTQTELQVIGELTKTQTLIAQAGGPAALSLFRYPYGSHTPVTDQWIAEQGYTAVNWSIDPKGWKQSTTSSDVITTVQTEAKSGDIVLMHCGSNADEGALDQVIVFLQERGYRLVTVSDLLWRKTMSLPNG